MDCAWILGALGGYYWHVLIVQEMLAAKEGSMQGDTEMGFQRNFYSV